MRGQSNYKNHEKNQWLSYLYENLKILERHKKDLTTSAAVIAVKYFQALGGKEVEAEEWKFHYLEAFESEKVMDLSSIRGEPFEVYEHAKVSMPFQLGPLSQETPLHQHHTAAEHRRHLQNMKNYQSPKLQ